MKKEGNVKVQTLPTAMRKQRGKEPCWALQQEGVPLMGETRDEERGKRGNVQTDVEESRNKRVAPWFETRARFSRFSQFSIRPIFSHVKNM